jgi:hypothetical protein
MPVGLRGLAQFASVAAVLVATVSVSAGSAGASVAPKAGFSINPAAGALTVTFVAEASGFPAPVVSYAWTFGDGRSKKTSKPTVTHTYPSPSVFSASLTETDGRGDRATAKGTLELFKCPVGTTQCTKALHHVRSVQLLQASGHVSPATRATLHLFVGPFRIRNCETGIAAAVGVTDTGFSGDLTVSLEYTTSEPDQVETTCFASTVPFVDAGDHDVTSGALPRCPAGGPKPPCVQSIRTSGAQVTKVLIIPAGDPKVGGP